MTRKKVKLSWIPSDNARRVSLKKRRQGLIKKVNELSTLCGLDACIIIYSPENLEPMIWPSHGATYNLLTRFHNVPEVERGKKMLNQENYLKERLDKTRENLKKIYRFNKEMEMTDLMSLIHNRFKVIKDLQGNEIRGLMWLLEEKCKEIRKRDDYFNNNQSVLALNDGGQKELPPDATDQVVEGLGSGGVWENYEGKINLSQGANPSLWDPWVSNTNMMNNNNNYINNNCVSVETNVVDGGQVTKIKQEFEYKPVEYNHIDYFGGDTIPNRQLGLQTYERNFNIDFESGMNVNFTTPGGGANMEPHTYPSYQHHHYDYLHALEPPPIHNMSAYGLQGHNHNIGMFPYGLQYGSEIVDDHHYGQLPYNDLTQNWNDSNNDGVHNSNNNNPQ